MSASLSMHESLQSKYDHNIQYCMCSFYLGHLPDLNKDGNQEFCFVPVFLQWYVCMDGCKLSLTIVAQNFMWHCQQLSSHLAIQKQAINITIDEQEGPIILLWEQDIYCPCSLWLVKYTVSYSSPVRLPCYALNTSITSSVSVATSYRFEQAKSPTFVVFFFKEPVILTTDPDSVKVCQHNNNNQRQAQIFLLGNAGCLYAIHA